MPHPNSSLRCTLLVQQSKYKPLRILLRVVYALRKTSRACRHQESSVYEREYDHVRPSAFSASHMHLRTSSSAHPLSPKTIEISATLQRYIKKGTHEQLFVYTPILQGRQLHVVQEGHSSKSAIRILELCEPKALGFVCGGDESLEGGDRTACLLQLQYRLTSDDAAVYTHLEQLVQE